MRIVWNELNMQLLVHNMLQFRPILRLLLYVCHRVRPLSPLSLWTTERTSGKGSKLSTNKGESKLLTSHTKTRHIKVLNEPEECWWMKKKEKKSHGSVKKKKRKKKKKEKARETRNYILNYALHFMPGHYPDLFS